MRLPGVGIYFCYKKYLLTAEEIRQIVVETIALSKIDGVLSKPQLTHTEAMELYGQTRVRDWIKAKLLRPVSQNGRGAKKYYSHKRIIELSEQSRTNLRTLVNNK